MAGGAAELTFEMVGVADQFAKLGFAVSEEVGVSHWALCSSSRPTLRPPIGLG
jgi:hypothetical protein